MSEKFAPRIITPEQAAMGYNNEGRGKLQGYSADGWNHSEACHFRNDRRQACNCKAGLWREELKPPAMDAFAPNIIMEPKEAPPSIARSFDPKGMNYATAGSTGVLRELTSKERKACPVVTGVLHYFPDAIMAISRVSKDGNDKHNPGEPLHWARGKSNDHLDSEGRHLLTPAAKDPDSGELEAAHKAWRALADLQLAEEKRLVAAGIRPLSGVVT